MTATGDGNTRECAGCGKPFTPNSARQKYHSPACRKKTQAKAKGEPKELSPEERVVQWATTHGAPIRLLEGWDPDSGDWANGSPIADMLADIARGAPIATSARRQRFWDINEIMYRGAEYATSEDRMRLPVEVRPLVDLYHLVNIHESGAEIDLSTSVYDKAMTDGKLGLDFLGRRWPSRWREQQQISTAEENDEREAAVSALISDPAAAMALAEMATRIEDQIEADERQS